tara:strand:+ start:675 stop:1031 length:357 start_codon:yes stop_codon:yes gene_type:complete
MPICQNIISGNQQPHDGYGYVGLAGNKGLGAAGKILGSGVFPSDASGTALSRPAVGADGVNMTAASGNTILGPSRPGTGADRQVGPIGDTVALLNDTYSDRFDETNYYHGSGTYNGPS